MAGFLTVLGLTSLIATTPTPTGSYLNDLNNMSNGDVGVAVSKKRREDLK
mgnify:CR=1 FL=1